MIAIPAIDLREGQCVQLVGGDYAAESVRLDDPLHTARRWEAVGFTRLHVVDLDAATGRGENRDVVQELLRQSGVPVQVGGGLRDGEQIATLLGEGAERVIVGTRAIEEPAWLEDEAARAPGRLMLAADVRGRRVVTHGWSRDSGRELFEFLASLEHVPLAGVLVTTVQHEGRMQGTDLALFEELAAQVPWPVTASGGIATLQDLRNLETRGVAAAVLGMALYTDVLDPRVVAEEFAE